MTDVTTEVGPTRPSSVVVRPRRPAWTPFGTWFVRLSLPWALVSLIGMDVALSWAGLPPAERPLALRLATITVGAWPVAIVLLSPLLVRLPGFDWLFARPQPATTIDEGGLALQLPQIGRQRFDWEQIGSLRFTGRWNEGSVLRTPDGMPLATVPDELVHPKIHVRTAYTLAESVVRSRPDRYALAPDNPSLGRPASFDLRERVGDGGDPVEWRRRRDYSLAVIFGGVIVLGIIGVIALLAR
jgi:Bacterial PH domain